MIIRFRQTMEALDPAKVRRMCNFVKPFRKMNEHCSVVIIIDIVEFISEWGACMAQH